MYRPTYVKIANDVLTENVKKIVKKYDKYSYYIGVVKANAYGHGCYIVDDLIKGGINYLATSSLEEAISVRKYQKTIPILCLEPIDIKYLDIAITNHVTLTIHSLDYLNELLKENIKETIKVHIKIDSGMSRLGLTTSKELEQATKIINNHKNIFLEGIYTHLATSGTNDPYYDRQINKFKEITKNIDLSKIEIVHLNRSITLTCHEKLPFETGTRLGIIMYGFNQKITPPIGLRKIKSLIIHKIKHISPVKTDNDLNLKTAFSLYSEVISIKKIHKNDFVGYGATYIAKEDMTIAIIPIGYADGMNKDMQEVSINNKKYPIIGDICMDMTIIKVDKEVKLHDTVEIFGDNISIKTVAKKTNTNAYHILTSITTRVPRIYQDKKEIKY